MPRPATGGTEFGEHAISKPRRPRWTPSEDAKALLEKVFSADSFPTFAVRSQLAEQLSIDSRQVQIWFQNRRQRERLKTGSHATALTEADEEVDDIPTGAGWQEVVPPRVALLGSLDDGVPSSRLGQSDTQTTWDAQDADVTRLADTCLSGGTPDCSVQVPACGPAPVARDPGSPRSAGSDETSHTSLVHPAALSLQTSPLLTSSPALDTLVTVGGAAAGSGSMLCSAVLPDAAQAARTLELPGGGTVDLPSGAPPALHTKRTCLQRRPRGWKARAMSYLRIGLWLSGSSLAATQRSARRFVVSNAALRATAGALRLRMPSRPPH